MAWFREWLRGDGGGGTTSATAPSRDVPGARSRTDGRDDGAAQRSTRRGTAATPIGEAPAGPRPSGSGAPGPEPSYPGERLGLPETGSGSVATLARRGAQFVLDALLAGLIALLFTLPAPPGNWSLLSWAVIMIVPVAVVGTTPAMALLGLRVVRLDRPDRPAVGLLWTVVRTASVFFVVPALLVDRDGRGVHDRASRTIVLRSR